MKPVPRFSNAKVNTGRILSTINTVEADLDWDGISSAIQIKKHYPKVRIRISDRKSVPSNEQTLVLDKGTYGNGWVIDHHPINMKSKNLLNFCPSGDTPTGRLTYEALPNKNETDLFLSATAEISDGLYEYGMLHGSIKELLKKKPFYFKRSEKVNQFMVTKEIYLMSDIFCVVANDSPKSALDLGLKLYSEKPRNAKELIKLLNSKESKVVNEYLLFMENFPDDLFEHHKIRSHDVSVADARRIGKFSHIALQRTRTKYPGNYVLFRGDRISLRTNDTLLFDVLIEVLGKNVLSYGGRKDWHGIRLKKAMPYTKFLKIIDKSAN